MAEGKRAPVFQFDIEKKSVQVIDPKEDGQLTLSGQPNLPPVLLNH